MLMQTSFLTPADFDVISMQKYGQFIICLGVRSIEHRNVLGEKINFSVHSARRIAIFGRDDLDPLNINANLFLDPPDPPYMSKNDKMCHF